MVFPADMKVRPNLPPGMQGECGWLRLPMLLFAGFAPAAAAPTLLLGFGAKPTAAAGAVAAALLMTGLASWLIARMLTRPIENIAHAMGRITAGQVDTRVGGLVRSPRELALLGRAFDAMAEHVSRRKTDLLATILREQGANRAKSEFLANMSHEFRTPLNAIIGFSEIIERELYGPFGNDKYRSCISDIHASGMHLLTMINEVLDIAKAESGRMDVQYEPVSVRDIIDQSVRMVRPRAAAKSISLEIDIPSEMPTIESDELKLRQVLINLLSNAVKFTEAGGAVRVAAGMDGAMAWLRVSDSGIGIAPADLPRVLEPFCQVENPLGRQTDGTGLGLPLAKKLIEIMGGTLTLSSELGVGTAVEIRVPQARMCAAPEHKAA